MFKRLTVKEVGVLTTDRERSSLEFAAGANVVSGASDSGKSYFFELTQFMFGAGTPPRNLPEKGEYVTGYMSFECDGELFTFERDLSGGEFTAYPGSVREKLDGKDLKTLRERHSASRNDSYSSFLLERLGILSVAVLKNADGESRSLSFSDLRHLSMVSEIEILKQGSPVLSREYSRATAEKSIFRYIVTGDQGVALRSLAKTKRQRRDAAQRAIQTIETEMGSATESMEELEKQLRLLDAHLDVSRNELNDKLFGFEAVAAERSSLKEQSDEQEDRGKGLRELLRRYQLLDRSYSVDLERLAAVFQTASLLEMTDSSAECPLCGLVGGHVHDGESLREVRAACEAEVGSIQLARRDLSNEVDSIRAELDTVEDIVQKLGDALKQSKFTSLRIQRGSFAESQTHFDKLSRQRVDLADKLLTLKHLAAIQGEVGDKPEVTRASDADEGPVHRRYAEFSEEIEEVLRAWGFPYWEKLSFSEDALDIAFDTKGREDFGKGFRAITQAAFLIGLMRYCHRKDLPHPGFVVLDTPVNPYKKADEEGGSQMEGEKLTVDMKKKFFASLGELASGGQIIIIENEDQPANAIPEVRWHHFTGNPHIGRRGFFRVPGRKR
jgi:hypothetical protein